MNLEQWNLLTKNQQDVLVQKHGLTRSGADVVLESELKKIPELKVEVKAVKKEAKKEVKLGTKKTAKKRK